MTLPHERYRALRQGYDFLLELMDPKATPKVPKETRQRAASVLKHYPTPYDFEQIADALPNHFQKEDPFFKMREEQLEKNWDHYSGLPSVDDYIPEGEKDGC